MLLSRKWKLREMFSRLFIKLRLRLYRNFVLIVTSLCIIILLVGCFVLRETYPSLRSIKIKNNNIHNDYIAEEPSIKVPINIWDTTIGDDRIVQQINFRPTEIDKRRPKVILLDGSTSDWKVKNGDITFKEHECLVQNCLLTEHNLKYLRIDARLFGQNIMFSEIERLTEAKPRTNGQVWIFFSLESPFATPRYEFINGVFNWTATYRRDSTIVTPYEKWVPFSDANQTEPKKKNYAERKTKKVAMFVSNCFAFNSRLEYAQNLGQYIPLDIFGSCGSSGCQRGDENCYATLKKEYKFYLSFENANCRHYVTEKFFFNALRNDVLPIVMGAHPNDYRKMAPPNSFIHVDDFESPEVLAKYLQKLDNDDNLYNSYFKWKGTGEFVDTKFWCRLCAMLNDPIKPRLVVDNLEEWWRGEDICLPSGNNIKWIN